MPEWFLSETDAHSLVPAITEALYDALSRPGDSNGLHTGRADLDMARFASKDNDDSRLSRTRVTVVIDEDNEVL